MLGFNSPVMKTALSGRPGLLALAGLALTTAYLSAETRQPTPHSSATITGSYLEVRSCDVYTGPCFANAEMGSDGKEATLVWSIDRGTWNGTRLDGLKVIAVVRTKDTLGDIKYEEPKGDTVLILDQRATGEQRKALTSFARQTASKLIGKVVDTHALPIESTIGNCLKEGTCAEVKAGELVKITTRCLCDDDHVCGNEYLYYPPLTKIRNPIAAFTETFAYRGDALNVKWDTTGLRSAYVGAFAL